MEGDQKMENNNFLEGYILRINDDVKNAIEEIKDMETKIHPVYYSLTRHFDDINMHVNYGSSSYTNSQANKGTDNQCRNVMKLIKELEKFVPFPFCRVVLNTKYEGDMMYCLKSHRVPGEYEIKICEMTDKQM